MKPTDLCALLLECYKDKLALYLRHQAGARLVSNYEVNNTYQYILAREDVHLSWLRDAIAELGGQPDDAAAPPDVPTPGKGPDGARVILEDDARRAREFVDDWRPRVQTITHARHRKLLELMLGEVAEHRRFFDLALAGRADLLGRRPGDAGTGGGVLARRWVN